MQQPHQELVKMEFGQMSQNPMMSQPGNQMQVQQMQQEQMQQPMQQPIQQPIMQMQQNDFNKMMQLRMKNPQAQVRYIVELDLVERAQIEFRFRFFFR